MDLKSFLKGLALGLAGKPLEFAPGKEPVAYLYNGVRLPKLPEWDKETYPYAYIAKYSMTEMYHFRVFASPLVFNVDDATGKSIGLQTPTSESIAYCCYHFEEGDADWRLVSEASTFESTDVILLLKWANHTVYHENGTVYMAASDPVPVYE